MEPYILLALTFALAALPASAAWHCNGLKAHRWPVKLAVVVAATVWLSPPAFVAAVVLLGAVLGIDVLD